MFLLDAEGRLLHANAMARGLIGSRHSISKGHDEILRLDRTSMRDLIPRLGSIAPRSLVIETADGDRLVGDVAFEPVRAIAAAITPVPGGVGPMTIAMLLKNTLTAARLATTR